uniref:Uncharacterized protein n=1 Tax=Solanum tuberosum TaxID=4113 RepID=M1B9U1_SOLTU
MAEGEAVPKPTYAAQIISKTPTQSVPKTQLKSIKYVHGEPTLQFTFKELDEFATEQGLHQAIVMKFSYGALEIQELRSILPKQFAIKEKTSDNEAQGVVEVQNNLVNIKITVGNQVVPTDNVPIGITTVEFDPNGKHAKETEHEATQRVEKSSGEVSAQHGSKGWNVVPSKKAAATSTNIRWANMVEEEEEHVTLHSKLILGAPAFVPKGSSIAYISSPLHRGRQLILAGSNVQKVSISDKELIDALGGSDVERLVSLTPINTNKQLQVGGSSTFSPNQFANLQDEESDEEDWLDQCFENAARDADISPRQ